MGIEMIFLCQVVEFADSFDALSWIVLRVVSQLVTCVYVDIHAHAHAKFVCSAKEAPSDSTADKESRSR